MSKNRAVPAILETKTTPVNLKCKAGRAHSLERASLPLEFPVNSELTGKNAILAGIPQIGVEYRRGYSGLRVISLRKLTGKIICRSGNVCKRTGNAHLSPVGDTQQDSRCGIPPATESSVQGADGLTSLSF